jgi:hypothetical protein
MDNPSPNIEIETKYVRETRALVYSLVFSAYVYTYVALHIRRCLKCMEVPLPRLQIGPCLKCVTHLKLMCISDVNLLWVIWGTCFIKCNIKSMESSRFYQSMYTYDKDRTEIPSNTS